MRFMLLMIPHGYENAAPGTIPDDVDAVAAGAVIDVLRELDVLLQNLGATPVSELRSGSTMAAAVR